MCDKVCAVMSKVGVLMGVLCMILGIVSRQAEWFPFYIGPRSFAAASALFLLLAIAANTKPRSDGGSCPP